MEVDLGNPLIANDPRLIDHIVGEVKSQGIFDQFRKECLADVDTKPAYQNLRTRVEGSVNLFLNRQTWRTDLNKNQLRETLRKHIHDAPYLEGGVERIVDQVVNPKIYSVFMPQIEDVVYKYLGIEKPKPQRNGFCDLKDLLPKDLDPISPESDRNSFGGDSPGFAEENTCEKVDNAEQQQMNTHLTDGNENSRADMPSAKGETVAIGEENEQPAATSPEKSVLNTPFKSDEASKTDDDDESPVFEPIDSMNLNDSNASNDSHLSGISELTSHRSHSPDFSTSFGRDNFDCSNQDSQLSRVSSNSRLSIVTDFSSSNHALTPVPESKEDAKSAKDSFRAIQESSANEDDRFNFEMIVNKNDSKASNSSNSRDTLDSNRSKNKDGISQSLKDDQESISGEKRSRSREHQSAKGKSRDEHESESQDSKEDSLKLDEYRMRESNRKDDLKEVKDLKDLYKEKIRELREKKEMTEKEKLAKEMKETNKSNRDSSGKRESPLRDKEIPRKNHKSSSSSRHSVSRSSKSKNSDSKDRNTKHESRRHSNGKSNESRSSSGAKRDSKSDSKSESRGSEKSSKDKKRRDEKKAKSADDHSSQRKNFNDRRSTDRDGSNGSSKYSQKNSYGASTKRPSNNLSIDSSKDHHSSGETSDSVNDSSEMFMDGEHSKGYSDKSLKRMNSNSSDRSLPLKKRLLQASESPEKDRGKKPRMEAKKSPRKRIDKDSFRSDTDVACVPDDERVQIIEIPYEDFEEPYPDSEPILSLEETQKIILDTESMSTPQSKLSEMEQSIRQSLNELMSDHRLPEQTLTNSDSIPCEKTLLSILSDDPVRSSELGQVQESSPALTRDDDVKHTDTAEMTSFTREDRLENKQDPITSHPITSNAESASSSNNLILNVLDQNAPEDQKLEASNLKDTPNSVECLEKQQEKESLDSVTQDDSNLQKSEINLDYAEQLKTTEGNAELEMRTTEDSDSLQPGEKIDSVQSHGSVTNEELDDRVDQDDEDSNNAEEFGDDDKLVIDEDFNEQSNVQNEEISPDLTEVENNDGNSVSSRDATTHLGIVEIKSEISHDKEWETSGSREDNREKYEANPHSREIVREKSIPEEIIIDDDEDEQFNNDDEEKSIEMDEDIVQDQIKNQLIDELGKLDEDESDNERPSVEIEFRDRKLDDQVRETTAKLQISEVSDGQRKLELNINDDEAIDQNRAQLKHDHRQETAIFKNDESETVGESKDNDDDESESECDVHDGNKKDELIIICEEDKAEGVKEVTLIFDEDSNITEGNNTLLKPDIINVDSTISIPEEVEQHVRTSEKKDEVRDEVQVSKGDAQSPIDLEEEQSNSVPEKIEKELELGKEVVTQKELAQPESSDIQEQDLEEAKPCDNSQIESLQEMNTDQNPEQTEEANLTPGDFEYLEKSPTAHEPVEKERDCEENIPLEGVLTNKEGSTDESACNVEMRVSSPVETDCLYLESDNYKRYIAFKNFLYKLETSYVASTKDMSKSLPSPAEPPTSTKILPAPILSKRKAPLSPIPESAPVQDDLGGEKIVEEVPVDDAPATLPSTSKKRKVGRAKKAISVPSSATTEKPQALGKAQKQQQFEPTQQSAEKSVENPEPLVCQELQPPPQQTKSSKQQTQPQAPQLSTSQQKLPHQAQSAAMPNGETFVMPPSPDSDVSASSDKNLGNASKDERRSHRSSQRYSSDDLYKPRPLFASSSRRTRRSHQA